jgi:hypothetical protein
MAFCARFEVLKALVTKIKVFLGHPEVTGTSKTCNCHPYNESQQDALFLKFI